MDLMTIVTFLSYILIGMGGWLLKTLWNAVDNLKRDISSLQERIAKEYMPRDDIERLVDKIVVEIRDFRREVRDDLKNKADK